MKKIICFPFVGDKIGGSHISTLIINKNIERKSFSPIVVIHSNGVLKNYLRNKKIKFFELKNKTFLGEKKFFKTNFFNFLRTLIEIILFLKKNKVDIVHTNDLRIHLAWTLGANISGCKSIWHQRSLFPNWLFYKIISRLSNKIISISKYVHSSLPEFNKKKSEVLYNPFVFRKEEKKKNFVKKNIFKQLKINNRKYVVTFIANLEKRKKPFVFIKASSLIQKKLKNKVVFIMIGDERDKKINAEILKYSKNIKNFFYLGFKKNINDWLYGSDILIVPAINEPFGRTIVESMALKTIVLASNSGGHREIIKNGKNGLLFKKNNIVELSKLTYKILINQRKKKIIINNAYDLALKNYSTSSHIKRIQKIYKSL